VLVADVVVVELAADGEEVVEVVTGAGGRPWINSATTTIATAPAASAAKAASNRTWTPEPTETTVAAASY
jgi:hypothetical protein